MLNIVSILIGLAAAPLVLVAFLPFFGWALWIILLLPAVGLIVGYLSSHGTGRKLNGVLLVIGAIRLMLGGGLF